MKSAICSFLVVITVAGCSKSIRPESNFSQGNGDLHDMSGYYTGLGSWTANGQTVDQSPVGKCITPDFNKPGVVLSNLSAKIYVSDDSKGHITVNFLKNVNTADGIELYPGPKVVHYIITDYGDHAQDSVGNYYFGYASMVLLVHFSLPGLGGPCTSKDSYYNVTNSGSQYIYSSVGTWDFSGNPD